MSRGPLGTATGSQDCGPPACPGERKPGELRFLAGFRFRDVADATCGWKTALVKTSRRGDGGRAQAARGPGGWLVRSVLASAPWRSWLCPWPWPRSTCVPCLLHVPAPGRGRREACRASLAPDSGSYAVRPLT